MTDQTPNGDATPLLQCPWCSASLKPDATTCPSCGANLTDDEKSDVPGVTAIDQSAVGITRPPAIPPSRNRLLSWINGDPEEEALSEEDVKALAPPDVAVRAVFRRLELEAEVANLQAEADARLAEAAEAGRSVDIPEELKPYAPEELVEAVDPDTADHHEGQPPA
jgi:hypothetical protein